MPLDLTALAAEVARDATVDGSASTLILSLADQIAATAGDQAAVNALADTLRANSDSLAAAVAANTPAAPTV